MNENLRDEWIEKLGVITPQEWEGLKEWYSSDSEVWSHLKFYKRTGNNDGFAPQTYIKENGEEIIEIPYLRKTAYPSNGRFGLTKTNTPMSFWAKSWTTATFENIKEFKKEPDDLTDEKLFPYLEGNYDPDPNLYGFSLPKYFLISTPLLYLNNPDQPFFDLIERFNLWEGGRKSFYDDVIFLRDDKVYPLTHAIAHLAYAHSFHGIVYKSVRISKNISLVDPIDNIALFDETNLKFPPEEEKIIAKKRAILNNS